MRGERHGLEVEVDEGVKGEEGDILGRVEEIRREVLVFNKVSGVKSKRPRFKRASTHLLLWGNGYKKRMRLIKVAWSIKRTVTHPSR